MNKQQCLLKIDKKMMQEICEDKIVMRIMWRRLNDENDYDDNVLSLLNHCL